MDGCASPCRSILLVVAVVVDEAAVGNDLALRLGQGTRGDRELSDRAVCLDDVSGEAGLIFQYSLPQTGDEDVIAQSKDFRVFHQERGHAPVDAVGAVTLGGVLLGKVGGSAHHALAGGSLLTGGTVAGHIGEDGGADVGVGRIVLHTGFGQGSIDIQDFLGQGLARLTVPLDLAHLFAAGDVLGVAAAQGELGQALGVGAVGRSLTGGDELVGGGDGVGDVADDLDQQVVGQGGLLGPILDVRAELQLVVRLRVAPAVVICSIS